MAFQINSKKIAKNTITLYIRQFVTMIISFFTVRVTLAQLGVEDYGLNNLVGSIVSMFSFINGSMGTAVQRFYSYEIGKENESELKKIFGVGLFLHLIVAFITLLIAEVFAIFFLKRMNIPENRMFAAQIVFQISIITLVLGIITVPYSSLLRARELFSKTALVEIVQAFLRLLNLYLLVAISYDKLIVLSFLNFLVSCGGIIAFVVMGLKFKETHSFPLYDKKLIKEMLSFVSLLLITVLASLLNSQGIVMLVNLFFGLALNAAYGVALQVQNAVNTFATNFKHSMVPQIMAAYGGKDYEAMHKLIQFGTKITFLLLAMITFPIMFTSEQLLTIWLKQPPERSSQLVIFVLIYINISSFMYFYGQGIHATGKILKQQIWLSSTYILSVLFVFLFYKFGFDISFAILVNIGFAIIQGIINLYYSRKYYFCSLKYFFFKIFIPCVFILLIYIVFLFILKSLFITKSFMYICIIFIFSLFIIPAISLFILFDKLERVKVFEFIKKIFIK